MAFLANHQVRSIEELTSVLELYTEDAINKAMEIAKEKLIEIINEDIYNNGKSDWYERQGDINDINNWTLTIDHRYKTITVNLHFDDNELGHHGMGNKILDTEGFLEVLNDPLSVMDFNCNLSHWYDYPHSHFWDDFQDWMRDNFMDLVRSSLQSNGIEVK